MALQIINTKIQLAKILADSKLTSEDQIYAIEQICIPKKWDYSFTKP